MPSNTDPNLSWSVIGNRVHFLTGVLDRQLRPPTGILATPHTPGKCWYLLFYVALFIISHFSHSSESVKKKLSTVWKIKKVWLQDYNATWRTRYSCWPFQTQPQTTSYKASTEILTDQNLINWITHKNVNPIGVILFIWRRSGHR